MASETQIIELLMRSWVATEGVMSVSEVREWISERNRIVNTGIYKTTLANTGWFYDAKYGQIVNEFRTFFQVSGLKCGGIEQPIFLQDEIGYLGILTKPIDGIIHFLLQAKIEPGNVNKIQLSPTLQATKSNFMQTHGGAKPAYLDWFLAAEKHRIIVDQLQSEQSSRFLGKRNRNIIILVDEKTDVEELPSHKWLTLGQIKRLLRIDNLVNMDTRTVLSCLPISEWQSEVGSFHALFEQGIPFDKALLYSIFKGEQSEKHLEMYRYINNYKMFEKERPTLVPLFSLKQWEYTVLDEWEELRHVEGYPFKLVFCNVSIEGREVRSWGQPLFEAMGSALYGLFTRVNAGVREFLLQALPEVGCFDGIELAPCIQLECTGIPGNDIEHLFLERYENKQGILYDVLLSEEGGRFYHEQNRNVIIEIEADILAVPPPGYWWCTYKTLAQLVQTNNVLNIQLRSLMSLLEVVG